MLYRIVGVDEQHVIIEFRKNNEEMTFQTYEEAEKYLYQIKQEGIIPDQYKLEIKK